MLFNAIGVVVIWWLLTGLPVLWLLVSGLADGPALFVARGGRRRHRPGHGRRHRRRWLLWALNTRLAHRLAPDAGAAAPDPRADAGLPADAAGPARSRQGAGGLMNTRPAQPHRGRRPAGSRRLDRARPQPRLPPAAEGPPAPGWPRLYQALRRSAPPSEEVTDMGGDT